MSHDSSPKAHRVWRGDRSRSPAPAFRNEVDKLLQDAKAAGAMITPAHDGPWGIYSGYFRDPDGHLWEVIWNPGRVPARRPRIATLQQPEGTPSGNPEPSMPTPVVPMALARGYPLSTERFLKTGAGEVSLQL